MTTALATTTGADLAEQVAIAGDLAKLAPEQRMAYYGEVCRSMGLNPLTRPFEYIVLNDKLTLYARRDATDQLRKIYGVNISIVARETVEGVYVVTARATTMEGRSDESVGAVPLVKEEGDWQTAQSGKKYFKGNGQYRPLGPEDRANAMMKAETKAKRRVTLSVVGLGWLDETELETIPSAKRVQVSATGDVTPDASYDQPISPPATSKQRGYVAALMDDLGWHSEYMAIFAKGHNIDLFAMTMADASYLIEQMRAAIDEPAKVAKEAKKPSPPPVDDLAPLATVVRQLRAMERDVAGEPPPFTPDKRWSADKLRGALEAEQSASRARLHTWLSAKVDAAPALDALDDKALMDVCYSAAGL